MTRPRRPQLFDTGPRKRRPRGTTTDLVPTPPRCPDPRCNQPLHRLPAAHQPALFYHGGYGATQTTVIDICTACGNCRTAAIDTTNPRHHTHGGAR